MDCQRRVALSVAVSFALFACGQSRDDNPSTYPRSELLKPETCNKCHADHFREWSGSMHAYAADDPVFRAMNARGQRETNGALGDFCVRCHAPMAVKEGATKDGLNLDDVPAELHGITCYFCHDAREVTDTHNAPITLANDTTMRGGLGNAVSNPAHCSSFSKLFDRYDTSSASACGSCHDIVLPSPPAPAAVELERTYQEWKASLFSGPAQSGGLTCNGCHMPGRDGTIADFPGVKLRRVHSHEFAGADLALTQFPETEAQKTSVENLLDQALRYEICVRALPGAATLHITIENVSAGHHFPTGAAQDRRAWAEVVATNGTTTLYQSGQVPAGEPATASKDPDLWLIRDHALGADGKDAHMFWQVASYQSSTIPAPVTLDSTDPDYLITHVVHRYPAASDSPNVVTGSPDRVTLKVWLEPIGLDVLDDLVASGDLDAATRNAMPRHALLPDRGSSDLALEWTSALAQNPKTGYTKQIEGVPAQCVASSATVSP